MIDLYSRVNLGAKVIVLPLTAKAKMAAETRSAAVVPAPTVRQQLVEVSFAASTPSTSQMNGSEAGSVRAHGLY